MRGKDLTIGCDNSIIQAAYNTGRVEFHILIGKDGASVVFSGIDGAKPDKNTQIQDLDSITFNLNIPGIRPNTEAVSGTCSYSNPYLGPMTIACQAVGKDKGAYILEFRTDGSEPQFISP